MPNEMKDELDAKALEAAIDAIPTFGLGKSKVVGDRTVGDKLRFGRGTPNPRAYVEAAIRAYLLALRPQREDAGAGGGVVLAWRFRQKGMTLWSHMEDRPPLGMDGMSDDDWEVEPLYAAPQPSAPEGWVLVPVTPTHLMLDTGDAHMPQFKALRGEPILSGYDVCRDVWAGMLSASPSQPTGRDATEEGWIEWHGGKCPVLPEAEVEYRLRDHRPGEGSLSSQAEALRWEHHGEWDDIIAYRLAAPKPETAQKGGKS